MRIFLFLIMLLMSSCFTNNQINDIYEIQVRKLEALANEKYSDRYTTTANQGKKYVLVVNKTKKFSELGFNINYFLYDLDKEEILIEDYLVTGKVEWVSKNKIKAISRNPISDEPGTRQTIVYYFDAKEGKKEK